MTANDRCWCGSGAKHKRCHGDVRTLQRPPVEIGRVAPMREVPAGIARPDYVTAGRVGTPRGPQIHDAAGVARMRLGRFLVFTALGTIPFNLALVLAGYLLGENYEAVSDALSPYELPIYLAVGGGILFVLVRWIRGRGSPAAEEV